MMKKGSMLSTQFWQKHLLAAAGLLLTTSTFAGSCNPLRYQTCIAPFPSDFWTQPDTSSPTGRTIQMPDDVLSPTMLQQLPIADGYTPNLIFKNSSGYSTIAGAVFEFASLPLTGDYNKVVKAFDMTTGQAIAVFAEANGYAQSGMVAAKSNTLQVYPQSRWPQGHQILVVVTTDLPGSDLLEIKTAQLVAGSREAQYVGDLTAAITQVGISLSQVRTATLFTVRTQQEVIGPVKQLIDRTLSNIHPVRNLKMNSSPLSTYISGVVTGEVELDNYRKKNGTSSVDITGATHKKQWVPFRLTLPKSASYKPAGVVIYGHGISLLKETDILVNGMNAKFGLATMSIDFPNHGARIGPDGGYVIDMLNGPKFAAAQAGMMVQATFDFASVYASISQSLKNLDMVGTSSWLNPFGMKGDGMPDLRTDHISMEGSSLGGVLGLQFFAMAPKLDGAIFHVTGAGVSHILSQSILLPGVFSQIIPRASNGTEAVVLLSAFQQQLDYGDSINAIEQIRYPTYGQNKKPLLLVLGDKDQVVPNDSSVSVAQILDLPYVGFVPQALSPFPGLRRTIGYDNDGYGIRVYKAPTSLINLGALFERYITGGGAHLIMARPDAISDQEMFLFRFIANVK